MKTDFGAGFVLAAAQNLVDCRIRQETIECRAGVWPRHQQIEVADCFLPASQTAGCGDVFDAVEFAQIARQLVGRIVREAEQKAAGAHAVLRNRSQHFLFEFGAHTGHIWTLPGLQD
ncbi:MAG TPA: hypothetical protein VKT49_03850 [Bryobacteraceae bacterium]|nr:hypothetical protein [Bryobacteraceae bacterium]